jgi:RNA-binding protein
VTTPSAPQSLKGSDRKYLRGLAHRLKPVVYVGKTGLTPNVLAAIDEALEHHELIKIRFQGFKDQKQAFAETIAQESHSEVVGMVGHIVTFYRQQPDPEKRDIRIPSH